MQLHELSALKDAVFSRQFNKLDDLINGHHARKSVHFNNIYAGMLLCCVGEMSKGKKYFESALKLLPNDNFIKYVLSYLKEYGRMAPLEIILPDKQQYAEPRLLRELMNLSMFHIIRKNSTAHMSDFFKGRIEPQRGLHVLDVGIGDGSHLFSILEKLIEPPEIKEVTICGIEVSFYNSGNVTVTRPSVK